MAGQARDLSFAVAFAGGGGDAPRSQTMAGEDPRVQADALGGAFDDERDGAVAEGVRADVVAGAHATEAASSLELVLRGRSGQRFSSLSFAFHFAVAGRSISVTSHKHLPDPLAAELGP
jgi:hypothetical protein